MNRSWGMISSQCLMVRDVRKYGSLDDIAARLRSTRKALDFNQLRFAQNAGIASHTYNQYEQAVNRISLDFAIKLCERYGLTLDWIYFGDPSGLPFHLAQKLLGEKGHGDNDQEITSENA